jgi:hypothetical protein
MANRSSNRGNAKDFNDVAFAVFQQAVGDTPKQDEPKPVVKKNPAAVALGRLGGLKGGNARASALTPEKRKEIAKKAAEKRWGKKAEIK